jgi:phage major head subunit gpT-like protein/ribosomal protein S4
MTASEKIQLATTATIQLAEAVEGVPQRPTVAINAYNGGPVRVGGYRHPVVIDLESLQAPATIPLFRSHDAERIVGHGSPSLSPGRLDIGGVISASTPDAEQIVDLAKGGFPWQASVGVDVTTKPQFLSDGESAVVNGSKVTGPAYVVRGGELYEVSFVTLGADRTTSATVAASKEELQVENQEIEKVEAGAEVQAVFERAKLEQSRQREIAAIAQRAMDNGYEVSAIEAATRRAIEMKQEPKDFELQLLRDTRGATVRRGTQKQITQDVVECALSLGMGTSFDTERYYKPQTLEAARDQWKNGLTITEFLRIMARRNGWTGESNKDVRGLLRAAFAPVEASSGVSTYDVSGILSNVANKMIMDAFNAVDSAWRSIALISPVSDFKQQETYSIFGDLDYEKLGRGERIKHGTLNEKQYTNQADTYAKFLGIDRRDIINDDMGAFNRLRQRLGRGAATKLNKVFWTEFMDNATFFAAGNNNYISGASTNLSSAGLQAGVEKFMKQTDPDGEPLGIMPRYLLVPPEIDSIARELFVSTNNNTGGAATTERVPNANVFANRFIPVSTPYLSNTTYTGYSATAWYLLADPNELATIEVVFLNGVETPTVEMADADFDLLGISMRGYHDFGVNMMEFRGGVKSKGAA